MRKQIRFLQALFSYSLMLLLVACANTSTRHNPNNYYYDYYDTTRFKKDYAAVLPPTISTNGKKVVLVDPNVHAWGAYGADGHLVRAGLATAGGAHCPSDSDSPDCRTGIGTFYITGMGDGGCYSKVYPRPTGGGLMPYCMYFHDGQALHGSPDPIVIEDNVSHGCVRMRIQDAEWMRYNFAQVGTKVIVKPYN